MEHLPKTPVIKSSLESAAKPAAESLRREPRTMNKVLRLLCSFTLVAALLLAFPVTTQAADAMDTRTLAMANKPATVLLYTEYTAQMTLFEFTVDDTIVDQIVADILALQTAGQLGSDEASIMSAFVQLYATYLPQYAYYTGNSESFSVSTGAMGTGFIVTPDGYLVTNAHVVETNEDELYYYFAVSNLESEADAGIQSLVEEMRRSGYEMSQDEIDMFYEAYFGLLAQSFDLRDLQTTYSCYMGNAGNDGSVDVKSVSMDVRKVGEPSTAKDVAILKISGTNLPTVTLGDDASLRTGDQIYAMGYPGAATTMVADFDLGSSMQEPTLTQGIVSARRDMSTGSVIQMDASIHGGNSGGPLFNSSGEVVGINTFGLIDPQTGAELDGLNFAVPISTAMTYLNELNVTPTESDFTKDFKAALTAYNSGKYNEAVDILRRLNESNPGYPVVQQLLSDALAAADANPGSGGGDFPIIPVIIIVVIVVVVAAAVVILLMLRSRKKRATASYQTQGAAYSQQPPQYSQQYTQYSPQQPASPQQTSPQSAQYPATQQEQPAPVQAIPEQQVAPPPQGQQVTPPSQSSAPACPSCGVQLAAGTPYCHQCGTKL